MPALPILLDASGQPIRRTKASATGRAVFLLTMGQPVWTERDYRQLAKEGYEQNPIFFSAVRMIAEASASIPLILYREGKDGKLEEIETHPILDLLERPNPFESGQAFRQRWHSFLAIAGNSYTEFVAPGADEFGQLERKQRADEKPKAELYVLRPDRMRVALSERGYPAMYVYDTGAGKVEWLTPWTKGDAIPPSARAIRIKATNGASPIWHEKLFHPTNDVYGLPPIDPAARTIDVHNEAMAYSKAMLQNRATPSGAIAFDKDTPVTEETRAALKSMLEEAYSGPANAGRPLVLEGGMTWQQMGTNPTDLEFQDGKNAAARDIAFVVGVPPMLLGIPGDNTYSNYREALMAFWRQSVMPATQRFCRGMMDFLRPRFDDAEDFVLSFDVDQIAALDLARSEVWTRVEQSSVLTINEKREALGYDAYSPAKSKGPADELYQPAGQLPLGYEPEENGLQPGVEPGSASEPTEDEVETDDEEGEDKAGAVAAKAFGNERHLIELFKRCRSTAAELSATYWQMRSYFPNLQIPQDDPELMRAAAERAKAATESAFADVQRFAKRYGGEWSVDISNIDQMVDTFVSRWRAGWRAVEAGHAQAMSQWPPKDDMAKTALLRTLDALKSQLQRHTDLCGEMIRHICVWIGCNDT